MQNQEKLPKSFKTKWVKALKSGKYIQGQYLLYNEDADTYCCLGVACDITRVPKSIFKHDAYPSSSTFAVDKGGQPYKKVPFILHKGHKVSDSLVSLNDDKVPFEVIAGFINENL